MSNQPYLIPDATPISYTEEIKKSKFISYISHTQGEAEAKAYIQSVREQYPDARHVCWAYIANAPTDLVARGFSDDGEPSGTAGKPILDQITGSNIGEITAVVVRYFGGIKLGPGGLVKAYGGGIKQALSLLETKLKVPKIELSFSVSYDLINLTEKILVEYEAEIVASDYQAEVQFRVLVPYANREVLVSDMENRSRGRIIIPIDHNDTSNG